ncbi:MAG: hypothetical protein R2762_09280 [Bryobacteraceae bacterium]
MKKSLVRRSILLFAALAAIATAAPPIVDPEHPNGGAIVSGAIDALGGPGFLAMQDRVARGWSGLWRNGVARHAATRVETRYDGGSAAERHTFDKKDTHWYLFDAKGAHEVTYRGYRPLPAERAAILRDSRDDNILQILRFHAADPGFQANYRGMDVCEKQSGYLVDIAAGPDDPLLTVCFSQMTGLPIRQTRIERDPVTSERVETTTVFSRYADAGGVQWPRHVAHLINGELVSELFFESVAVNQGVSPERFILPHDLEKLK